MCDYRSLIFVKDTIAIDDNVAVLDLPLDSSTRDLFQEQDKYNVNDDTFNVSHPSRSVAKDDQWRIKGTPHENGFEIRLTIVPQISLMLRYFVYKDIMV